MPKLNKLRAITLNQKGISQIFLIFILTGIIAGTYITYQFVSTPKTTTTQDITTSKPSEIPVPEASSEPKVVSDQFVKVIFKEGVDISGFAKKYNIDETKIEGPDLAKAYRIPVPEGENVVSAIELFKKDPYVVSAKFELYAVPQ